MKDVKDIVVAPSVLSFNLFHLKEQLTDMWNIGIRTLHYDVMDGHFVAPISFGEHLFDYLAPKPFRSDVHLMVTNPLPHALWFFAHGADEVTVHYEAIKDDPEAFLAGVEKARQGRILGLALNPETEIDAAVCDLLKRFDKAMVMSVHPGASGQAYLEGSEKRVGALVEAFKDSGRRPFVEIDGGINGKTAPLALRAGATMLVSGSFLCKAEKPAKALEELIKG